MFGGAVKQTIDSRWCGHASIPKTAMDLLGLPALGVPRADQAPSLADLIDQTGPAAPPPPAFGTTLTVPPPPSPPVAPAPPPSPPAGKPTPVGAILLRDGSTLPPPNDAPLPHQSHSPRG